MASYVLAGLVGFLTGHALSMLICGIERSRSRGAVAVSPGRFHRFSLPVPAVSAVLFVLVYHICGWTAEAARMWTLTALLIPAAEVDRRCSVIPNMLILLGLSAGVVLHLWLGWASLATCTAAALAAAGALLVVRWTGVVLLGKAGMGMGDVKLAAVMGLLLGWEVFWVLYLAILLGGLFGLSALILGRIRRGTRLPFAPFIAAGSFLYLTVVPPALVLLW